MLIPLFMQIIQVMQSMIVPIIPLSQMVLLCRICGHSNRLQVSWPTKAHVQWAPFLCCLLSGHFRPECRISEVNRVEEASQVGCSDINKFSDDRIASAWRREESPVRRDGCTTSAANGRQRGGRQASEWRYDEGQAAERRVVGRASLLILSWMRHTWG